MASEYCMLEQFDRRCIFPFLLTYTVRSRSHHEYGSVLYVVDFDFGVEVGLGREVALDVEFGRGVVANAGLEYESEYEELEDDKSEPVTDREGVKKSFKRKKRTNVQAIPMKMLIPLPSRSSRIKTARIPAAAK